MRATAKAASTSSSGRRRLLQPRAARPAQVERRGILLAAGGAAHGRAGDRRSKEGVDQLARAGRVVVAFYPQLGKRRIDRELARDARGVRVEDARANAPIGEM